MKAISSTLCGLVTALTVSLSSPVLAEEKTKSSQHQPNVTISTNCNEEVFDNSLVPHCREISSTQKQAALKPILNLENTSTSTSSLLEFEEKEEEKAKTEKADDILDNSFPYLHLSGGSLSLRVVWPKGIDYNIDKRRFELTKNGRVECYYKTNWNSLKCYHPNLEEGGVSSTDIISGLKPKKNLALDNFFLGDQTMNNFYNVIKVEFPSLLKEGGRILSNFWDDLNVVLEPKKIEVAITYGSFFRDLLPEYTKNGVIDPGEAQEIKDIVWEKLKEDYEDLGDQDQQAINEAVDELTKGFNEYGNRYATTRILRSSGLNEDNIFEKLKYGQLSLLDWYNIFTNFEPVYDLKLDKNSFELTSDIYTRFSAVADRFNELHYNNHTFRYGFLSLTEGVGEAHLRLSGEIHGGKPIRDYFGENSNEDFDTLELLLGTKLVMIDGSAEGIVEGSVDLRNLHLMAYEEEIQKGNLTLGLGFTQGYVYHLNSNGKITLTASADSFADKLTGEVKGKLSILEKLGRKGSFYFFAEQTEGGLWFHTAAGMDVETLEVLERIKQGFFRFDYDYNLEGTYEYDWEEKEYYHRESIVTPLLSLRAGANTKFVSPFLFANREGVGGGILVNTPYIMSELEIGSNGYIQTSNLINPLGHLNPKINQEYQTRKQQITASLFPTTKARLNELDQRYWTKLDGLFVEADYSKRVADNFPHLPAESLRFGFIFAKQDILYLRTGFNLRGFGESLLGVYGSAGNQYFAANFSYEVEKLEDIGSHAKKMEVGLSVSIGPVEITGTGFAYLERTAYFLNSEEEGDLGVHLNLMGPMDIFY